MTLLPDLTRRHVEPEWMDQPGLDETSHCRALRDLARINRVSGSAVLLWPSIQRATQRLGVGEAPGNRASASPGRAVRVLDIACGGGDVAVQLWRRCHLEKLPLALTAIDMSPTAVRRTKAAAQRAGADFQVGQLDALREPLPTGYDVAIASLFIHHLSHDEAILLLRNMASAAHAVVVNDLERSRAGYVAARWGTQLLVTSPIVHVDAPRSVRAAFTVEELRQLAEAAGLTGARVSRQWPFRVLLEWERN